MHSKFKFVFVLAIVLFAVSPAFSQQKFKPFGNMSIGVKASTMGYGLEAATPLNNLFMLRLGINTMNGISFPEDNMVIIDKNGQFYESFDHVPELRIKPGIHFSHGNLLLDFHPAGIFHLTAGAFVGKSHLKVDGRLVDSNNQNSVLLPGKTTWPVIEVGDQSIDLTDGRAGLDLQMGNTLKPYLGIGFGRAVPKKSRISFKFELGVVFQKGYTLRQNGVVFDLTTISDIQELNDVHNNLIKYGALWPMLNFQLSYRIF